MYPPDYYGIVDPAIEKGKDKGNLKGALLIFLFCAVVICVLLASGAIQ
jgi:hypothetical protein